MEEPNYWTRWAKRRLSRRRLLTGAAGVGAGLAAVSVVGCGGGGEEAASPSPGASPAHRPEHRRRPPQGNVYHWGTGPPPPEPAKTRGGILRWFGFEPLPLDTLDPHQTQFGPAASMHSAVFSKVLKYEDDYARRDRARPGGDCAGDVRTSSPTSSRSVPTSASTTRRRSGSSSRRWPAASSPPRT